ncbi:hemin uptake protein HemP [Lignipirellula cremea]|uniref:Hemin uptake protein hemP n=1 Tax=Lignipirellula cremea TaxID=2528010 RepID=A0A518DUL9_9BACT|nr:hemin uptake protein HemP [Lignipirellula cremea]QDU95529.1 Hemin uptake protein hemP [Lignipirellula cremea]
MPTATWAHALLEDQDVRSPRFFSPKIATLMNKIAMPSPSGNCPAEPEFSPEDQESPVESSDRPLIYQSFELLQGRREVWIEHQENMYRLRLTSSGKLYLTK